MPATTDSVVLLALAPRLQPRSSSSLVEEKRFDGLLVQTEPALRLPTLAVLVLLALAVLVLLVPRSVDAEITYPTLWLIDSPGPG